MNFIKILQSTLLILFFPTFAFGISNQLSINLEGQGRFVLTNPAGERIGAWGMNVHENYTVLNNY